MEMREFGKRTKLTCNLPHAPDADLRELKRDVARLTGGYTCRPFIGGWVEEGRLIEESGTTFDVSFLPDQPTVKSELIHLFRTYGQSLGNNWIHIEASEFDAEHRRVN